MEFITVIDMVVDMVFVFVFFGDALFSGGFRHCGDFSPVSLSQGQRSAPPPPLRNSSACTRGIETPHYISAMPRIRGRLRRGAAWYAAASRRKRKAQFEEALAIVTRRRRHRSRHSSRPCMAPMAYVEEVIPEGGPPSPPANVFIPPENWHPSTSFDSHNTRQPSCQMSNPAAGSLAETYSPCYIQEEAPPEPTIDGETTGRERQENRKATTGTNANEETNSRDQPPAVERVYLDLVFEIRAKLEDLDFRLGRMDQRLDMFFAAHSRASAKKQCPTCTKPYSFPARWRHFEV
jgi:hypothetical protein